MTYSTLGHVRAAYAHGDLPAGNPLMIDEGEVWVRTADGEVFRAPVQQVLAQALDLLDIPYDMREEPKL